MDMEPLETNVYIHSPIIEYSMGEGYYTSYAVHLTSNNPCFSRPASHTRRRYSEFVRLRELLADHHRTLTPPALPPKNYFHRFNDDFIEQRMTGLQNFLKEVLAIPVYLSDKSLHMFLQSNSSMSEINSECMGDIPAPTLIDSREFTSSYSENSSRRTAHNKEAKHCEKSLHHLVLDDCKIGMKPHTQKETLTRTPKIQISSGKPTLAPVMNKNGNKPFLIPQKNGSLESSTASSPSSSPSSSDTGYCSDLERLKQRRVSFNEKVKVAVVTHYGISVLRP